MIAAEKLHELLVCDFQTGQLFWKRRTSAMFRRASDADRWNSGNAGKPALTAVKSDGYLHGTILKKYYKAHRVIWAMANGKWPEGQIDHINGNPADNRLSNLRDTTASQNSANGGKRPKRNPSSRFIGVSRSGQKWEAAVGHNGRTIRAGRFPDEIEAAQARDRLAMSLKGQFARLNFPQKEMQE